MTIAGIAAVILSYGCGSSNPADGGNVLSGAIVAPFLTSSFQHAEGQGWKRKDCFICHPVYKLSFNHKRVPNIWKAIEGLGKDADRACIACHGTNGLSEEEGGVRRCLICHGRDDIMTNASMFSRINQHDIDRNGNLDDKDCILCHDRPDMNGHFDVNVDLRNLGITYESVNDFCLSCHDINGAMGIIPPKIRFDTEFTDIRSTFEGVGKTAGDKRATADVHGAKDGDGQIFGQFRGEYKNGMVLHCTECHTTHASDNPYLIRETGGYAEKADSEGRTASVHVSEYKFDQLCAVCHTNPNGVDTGNGLKMVVHTGFTVTDCTDCHFHGAGYGLEKNNLF